MLDHFSVCYTSMILPCITQNHPGLSNKAVKPQTTQVAIVLRTLSQLLKTLFQLLLDHYPVHYTWEYPEQIRPRQLIFLYLLFTPPGDLAPMVMNSFNTYIFWPKVLSVDSSYSLHNYLILILLLWWSVFK